MFMDREDETSGIVETEDDENLLAVVAVLVEADLFRDGEILATGAAMGLPGLADVVAVVAWRIDVN